MEYLIILISIAFGVIHYDIRRRTIGRSLYIAYIFLCLTFLSAFRYRVGGDSLVYEEYFALYPTLAEYLNSYKGTALLGFQPLWVVLNAIIKSFGGNVYDFQMLHALIFNSALFYFLTKRTKYIFTFLFLFAFFFLYFYYSFEIQRESLAIAVFLLNIKNLEEKLWVRYYLLALISFLFHISAVIIFLFPLFRLIELKSTAILIIAFFGIFLTLFKSSIISLVESLLLIETMQIKAETYSQVSFSTVGLLSFYFVRVILPLPVILALNEAHGNKKNGFIFAFVVLSVMSQVYVGFDRLINYVYIWYIVEFVNLSRSGNFSFKWATRGFIRSLFIASLFFIIPYKIFTNVGYHSLFFPYENKFDKQKNIERETFIRELWKW